MNNNTLLTYLTKKFNKNKTHKYYNYKDFFIRLSLFMTMLYDLYPIFTEIRLCKSVINKLNILKQQRIIEWSSKSQVDKSCFCILNSHVEMKSLLSASNASNLRGWTERDFTRSRSRWRLPVGFVQKVSSSWCSSMKCRDSGTRILGIQQCISQDHN